MKRSRLVGPALLALLLLLALPALSESGSETLLSQYEARLPELEEFIADTCMAKQHPCIYITTLNRRPILSRDEYIPAVVDVYNCDDAFRLTAAGGVKVRGNSTANGDEKPYRIKFDRKQNMLGLHSGEAFKSWVLLRAQWNLAADFTAFRLGRVILGPDAYVSDCAYVNVYVNGFYAGLYLLCEQNQAAKGRVEVYEPKAGETGSAIGYLLELDNYPSDEHPYIWIPEFPEVTDIAGETRTLRDRNYSIKSDFNTPMQKRQIARWLEGTFTILYEAAVHGRPMRHGLNGHAVDVTVPEVTAYEAVDAVLDLESVVDMLILEELVHNYDVGEGSFYMAVDFAPGSRYPKLTFVAPWDFNWAYDGPTEGWYACTFQPFAADYDRSSAWFILAMKMPEFRALVRERWRALRQTDALEALLEEIRAEIASLSSDIRWNESWRIDAGYNIVNFVRGRIAWLDGQWLTGPEVPAAAPVPSPIRTPSP